MPAAQDIVDASEHYHGEQTQGVIPSLLSVIIDTNPRAWSALSNVISLTQAVGNILVYINTHLACDNANEVSIIAAHCHRAVWLYPTPPKPPSSSSKSTTQQQQPLSSNSGNEFPKFAQIKSSVFDSLRTLAAETTESDISSTTTTQISGALTLSLAHINKTSISLTAGHGAAGATGVGPVPTTSTTDGLPGLNARILVVSVSDSNPAQYITTMNAVFAAAHSQIPVDTLCLRGNPTFLQQASYLTGGAFIRAREPQGIIQYLMFGLGRCPPSLDFGSDNKGDPLSAKGKKAGGSNKKVGGGGGNSGRGGNPLMIPNAELVDFRAACFCHRKVVDTGFVCSVCLSIFCEVPKDGECLTCKSKLQLGNYGAKPVVV